MKCDFQEKCKGLDFLTHHENLSLQQLNMYTQIYAQAAEKHVEYSREKLVFRLDILNPAVGCKLISAGLWKHAKAANGNTGFKPVFKLSRSMQ